MSLVPTVCRGLPPDPCPARAEPRERVRAKGAEKPIAQAVVPAPVQAEAGGSVRGSARRFPVGRRPGSRLSGHPFRRWGRLPAAGRPLTGKHVRTCRAGAVPRLQRVRPNQKKIFRPQRERCRQKIPCQRTSRDRTPSAIQNPGPGRMTPKGSGPPAYILLYLTSNTS